MLLQDVQKVGDVLLLGVADAEVIEGEDEDNVVGLMGEQARSVALLLPMGFQDGEEGMLGDVPGLLETIHGLVDLRVDVALVVSQFTQVVQLNDLVRDAVEVPPNLL